ncbi:MAG: YbaK/EbsC family protein [Candidatus Woesearchaeota archaeon]
MNEKVQVAVSLLEKHGFSCEVLEAYADKGDVVKTVVFKKRSSSEPFAVAVKKDDRVSYKKIREIVDDAVSPLRPEELIELGWLPGECCPLTINCELFVDKTVLNLEVLHTGSGDINHGLLYNLDALIKIRKDLSVVDVREN